MTEVGHRGEQERQAVFNGKGIEVRSALKKHPGDKVCREDSDEERDDCRKDWMGGPSALHRRILPDGIHGR